MKKGIGVKDLDKFSKNFNSSKTNLIAKNAVTSSGILKASENFEVQYENQHAFSITIDSGLATDQKKSGRCWVFASLNIMRLEVMRKLNIENMELSQSYILFYDKLEKSNYFLENILDTLDEPTNGRLINHLLKEPMNDGGQWDMFKSLVEKYGVVPKDVYPESYNSSDTKSLEEYLTKKLREYAYILRREYKKGKQIESLRNMKEEMLDTIYRILSISLGEPPRTFTWETYDKKKKFIKVSNITQKRFYKRFVNINLEDYVCVINAPTKDKPYNKIYSVKYLGSVYDGKYPVRYLNLDIDRLKKLAIKSLKEGKVVWFGSDVGQFSNMEKGYLTLDAYRLDDLFNTSFDMNKAQRLEYSESLMTHAMVITGVDLDDNGKPTKWKVENSWGEKVGKKGYYVMSDDWFSEYVYEIIIDKKYLTKKEKELLDTKPTMLEPWDPMGSLAK